MFLNVPEGRCSQSFPKAYAASLSNTGTGRLRKSLRALYKAKNLNPSSASTYYNLGLVHAEMQEWGEALEAFFYAGQLSPNSPEAWNGLGVCHQVLGHRRTAKKTYKKALRIAKKTAAQGQHIGAPYHAAAAYLNLGQLQKSLRGYVTAAHACSASAKRYATLLHTLRAANIRVDAALADYTAAPETFNKTTWAQYVPTHARPHWAIMLHEAAGSVKAAYHYTPRFMQYSAAAAGMATIVAISSLESAQPSTPNAISVNHVVNGAHNPVQTPQGYAQNKTTTTPMHARVAELPNIVAKQLSFKQTANNVRGLFASSTQANKAETKQTKAPTTSATTNNHSNHNLGLWMPELWAGSLFGATGQNGGNYNVALGAARINFLLKTGLRYNDNIALSDINRERDLIANAALEAQINYPLSAINSLSLNATLGHQHYLSNSHLNNTNAIFTPGASNQLRAQIFAGPYIITLTDTLTYSEDAFDFSGFSDIDQFINYTNELLANIAWDVNAKTDASVDVKRVDFWVNDTEEFTYLNRTSHSIDGNLNHKFTPWLQLGLTGGFSDTGFSDARRSDFVAYRYGVTGNVQLSNFTSVNATLNRSHYDYNSAGDSNQVATTGSISFLHQPIERFTQSLNFARSFSPAAALGANYHRTDIAAYNMEYILSERNTLQLNISKLTGLEENQSKYTRNNIGLQLTRYLSQQTKLVLSYNRTIKTSDDDAEDYTRNLVSLNIDHDF